MPRKNDEVEAFCRALWRSDFEVVRGLVQRVEPNGRDRWGNTPLLMATQYGDLPLVQLLIERGADVDQQRQYLTPLTLAAKRREASIVTYLRDAGATFSIFTLIYLGDKHLIAKELRRDPTKIELQDEEGTPLLHHAVEALNSRIVSLLLDHGANIAGTDLNGETALHRLADIRQLPDDQARKLAKLLVDRGADVNALNWDHVTPLHQAVRARNIGAADLLLAHGADVNARDKGRGSTPLRRAVSQTGASGTAGTRDRVIPLVRLLLKFGADPSMKDKRGVAVFESARDPEVRAILFDTQATKQKHSQPGKECEP